MNLRWLWLDHFPAGLELTTQQRLDVRRRAKLHRRAEPNFAGTHRVVRRILLLHVTLLSILFTAWCLRTLWLPWQPRGTMGIVLVGALSPIIFNAFLWIVIAYAMNRSSAPFIRRALCDMGIPTCITCGYILRGLPSSITHCPECGHAIERQPTTTDSRIAEPIASIR